MKGSQINFRLSETLHERFRRALDHKGYEQTDWLRAQIMRFVEEVEDEVSQSRTLQNLTGQESGIVIYHAQNEGILCNWSAINGLPRIFGGVLVGLGEDIPQVDGEHTDQLADLLDGMNIRICADYDLDDLPASGTVYRISDDVTIVAPDGWN